MGWMSESPDHEGYLVGVEKDEHGLHREIPYSPDNKKARVIRTVQVGCECGWRSPRLHAPNGTEHAPHIVILPLTRLAQDFEDRARVRFVEHVEEERRRGGRDRDA